MPTYQYKNISDVRCIWPAVQRPDGSTLELGPGETAELNEKVDAAYLELVAAPPAPTPAPAPAPPAPAPVTPAPVPTPAPAAPADSKE